MFANPVEIVIGRKFEISFGYFSFFELVLVFPTFRHSENIPE